MAEKICKMNSEKWNPEIGAHFKFDGYGKIELPKGCNDLHFVWLFFFIYLPIQYIIGSLYLFQPNKLKCNV